MLCCGRWKSVCALALLWVAGAQAEVRVALVGADLTAAGQAAVELAEAELSARAGLTLLDRAAIGQVLREQNLAADGFAQPDDAVRLGQLLAVDVFIHAEAIPGEDAFGVAAFETVQGIRLLDRTVAGTEPDALAGALAAATDAALAKWQAPAGKAAAIALMGVRNVDLPKSRNGECEALGALLERRLLDSPDVVVVERKRLQSLNLDRELAPNRPEDRLLSAPVLVELDVEGAGAGGGLRAAAHLSNAKGGMLGIVRAGAKTAPELADKIGSKILEKLAAGAAIAAASPQLESARFFRQARFWKAQERFDLMLASAEAAYALDSTNPVMRMLLINALFSAANAELAPARPVALAYAARGMGMLRQPSPPPAFANPEQKKQFTQIAADVGNFFRGFGECVGRSRGENPFSDEEAASYADFCRDWLVQSPFSPTAKRAPSVWDLLLFVAEEDTFQYFPDSESAWRALSRAVKRWIHERMAKERTAIPPWVLFQVLIPVEDSLGVPPDYRIRAELWSNFVGHGDPLLNWFGRCGRVFDEARQMNGGDRWSTAESRTLLEDIQTALCAPTPEVDPEALCVVAWLSIRRHGGDIDRIDDRSCPMIRQQLAETVELTQAMLAAGRLNDTILNSVQSLVGAAERVALTDLRAESLRTLEQAAAAAEKVPASALSPDERDRLASFHDWVREQIEPGSTAVPPSENVRVESIDLGMPRAGWMGNAALIQDETGIYVLSAFCAPPRLLLQKWMLGDKALADLGMAEVQMPCPFGSSVRGGPGTSRSWVSGIDDVCLGSNLVVAALRKGGVVLFGRKSTATEALQQTTTLPVEHPLSVGLLGPILYVGTDDGYLVAYDTVARTGTVLAASSRKEKKSPFDDGPPVRITAIFPDPPRQRIVFLASVVEAESDLGMAVSPLGGIWEYLPSTKQFRQLVSYPHRAQSIIWCEMMKEGVFVVQDMWGKAHTFHLATDEFEILNPNEKKNINGTSVRQKPIPLGPPYLVRDDWLWVSDPGGRFSLNTCQFEKWPPFRMPDGSARELKPDMGMFAINAEQTLFATMRELWLVTMDGDPGRGGRDGGEKH